MAYRQPTSTIMLCKGYPCDRDHENTLYFATRAAQWAYMVSLVKSSSYVFSNQSYQRYAKNTLRINARADDLYDCNYMIFSNVALSTSTTPSASTPVFYAFIDKVEYVNENTTEIVYTLDDLQTFWFDFNMGECYVEREHTETDYLYGNLVPEKINCNTFYSSDLDSVDLTLYTTPGGSTTSTTPLWSLMIEYIPDASGKFINSIVSYTGDPTDASNYSSSPVVNYELVSAYGLGEFRNGVYNMARYAFLHLPPIVSANANKIRDLIMGLMDSLTTNNITTSQILSVALVPRVMAYTSGTVFTSDGFKANPDILLSITRPTTLKGPNSETYTPRNKKLLSYPFCALKIDNNNGENREFEWEYLDGVNASMHIKGVLVGAPEVVCYPDEYHGDRTKYTDYGVSIRDFIDVFWTTDNYAEYMNQNRWSVNIQGVLQAFSFAKAAASGSGFLSAGAELVGYAGRLEDMKSQPDKRAGSQSFSALKNVLKKYKFSFEQVNVYPATARRIDDYFDLYGYQVDTLKKPNVKDSTAVLRPHWNYVKTNGALVKSNTTSVCSPSADELEKIKGIFDKGVRFWMSGSEVGDYSSSNAPSI